MTAGDSKVTAPGKSPAVMSSVWSKDGMDGLGADPSMLEKSRTAHRSQLFDRTVDITGSCHRISMQSSLQLHHMPLHLVCHYCNV